MKHTKMILVGGWSMVLFAILFVGLNIVLNNIVANQPMLYDLERHQLFKVMAGTPAIRLIQILYSITPFLLIPGAVGLFYNFIEKHEANMRIGMYFATTAVVGLSLSLMMLPSINWYLAPYVRDLHGVEQTSMIVLLQSIHDYFGVFIGDLMGMGCLLVWFFITSIVMIRSNAMPHIVGTVQLIIALITALVLIARYSGLAPDIHTTVSLSALVALWVFICGISLISLRKD